MLNSIASLWKTTPCSGPFWPTCSKSRVSKVVECASAEAAEFVLVSTGTELRALVTDVNLAGDMSGVELAQYAKRKFPRLNVVMVSGKGPPLHSAGHRFLMKPYLPDELLAAVLN